MTVWGEDGDGDDEEGGSVPPRPSPVYAFTPRRRGFLSQLAAGLQLIAAPGECKRVETQLDGRLWAADKEKRKVDQGKISTVRCQAGQKG